MTSDVLPPGLIVSCQAYPGEPMRHPETMAQVAHAVVAGGAAAVRLQGLADLDAVAGIEVPVIGLVKEGTDGVFITPTLRLALAVAASGADVVAVDGTRRDRPDGLSLAQTIRSLKAEHGVSVMADCGSLDDAQAAEDAGADYVATTLAGYTGERPRTDGPDLELVAAVVDACDRPVIAEGRYHAPADCVAALAAGAHAVCVGTAITHPTTITGWFAAAIDRSD